MLNGILFGLKKFFSEIGSGDMVILFSSLILSVTAISGVGFLSDRFQRSIEQQASIVLGAEMVFRSGAPIEDRYIQAAELMEIKTAEITSFLTMALTDDDNILASIKAVSSALDNVMMPLEILGAKDAKERALKALDEVGLSKRTGHVPHQLSGGEKQRVAIARAMVKNPSILFADEPTGNLDQSSTDNILELLLRINHQTKTTLVVVTHDQQLAAQSDMVFELQEGKLKC